VSHLRAPDGTVLCEHTHAHGPGERSLPPHPRGYAPGHRLQSPALIADGNHARVDGFVSLGVLASAAVVGLGLKLADPIIGLLITIVILQITWQSWRTISTTDPGEMLNLHAP
jgi:Co/Zn/Cd efflux system component